jgi:hypothetical protein
LKVVQPHVEKAGRATVDTTAGVSDPSIQKWKLFYPRIKVGGCGLVGMHSFTRGISIMLEHKNMTDIATAHVMITLRNK